MDRRKMLKLTGTALAGSAVLGTDAFADNNSIIGKATGTPGKGKKAMVIGAHPDDPETGCGGTIMVLKKLGYEVVVVYMTRGEAGVPGKSHAESSAMRMKEAREACEVFGVRPIFMTQIDGSSEITKERYAEMKEVIEKENPDMVFTHWPIDSHRDHRICSILTYDAWRQLKYGFDLYYYEVMSGVQSMIFHPTDWVDITEFADIKKKATYCHKCQNPEDWYDESHGQMEIFRGMEHNCKRAEAFIHIRRTSSDIEE